MSPEVRLNRLNCVFLNSKPEKTSNSLLTLLPWPVLQSACPTAAAGAAAGLAGAGRGRGTALRPPNLESMAAALTPVPRIGGAVAFGGGFGGG